MFLQRKQRFPLVKVVTSFVVGAVSGAILGLLYAPMSGRKMQRKIADVTGDVFEKVEGGVETVQATVRKLARA